MSEMPRAMLMQAADDLKRGDKPAALRLIKQVLYSDPQNADAWFLASFLSPVPEERRAVLEQAVKYNPAHPMAQQALERIRSTDTAFRDLTAPTWAPDLSDALRAVKPDTRSGWEPVAFRLLLGLLIVVSGLLVVIVIGSI